MMSFLDNTFLVDLASVDIDDKTECPQLHLDIYENNEHHYYQRRHDQMTPQEFYMLLGMFAEIDPSIAPTFISWYKDWCPKNMDEKEKYEYMDKFNPFVLVSSC